jgi:hypothetical protein
MMMMVTTTKEALTADALRCVLSRLALIVTVVGHLRRPFSRASENRQRWTAILETVATFLLIE